MPAVLVRNLSDETHRALKLLAKARGNSIEAEIRLILDEAVLGLSPQKGLGTLLQEFGKKHGPFPKIVRDKSVSVPVIFE